MISLGLKKSLIGTLEVHGTTALHLNSWMISLKNYRNSWFLHQSRQCNAMISQRHTKATSGRPAYSPALCQINFAIARLFGAF